MHLLYSAAAALVLLLGAPWWLLQMLRHGKYRAGLGERLGRVPARLLPANAAASSGCTWIHAVSVGEVLAVARLVEEMRRRRPARRIVLSTTTATGQRLARERFGEGNVFYFPLDFAFAVRPYFRALAPDLVVMAETEFWPNFLRLARENGARVAVVNARISDRSLPGYRRWRALLGRVLRNVDLFLTQSEEDARRLAAIGALPERVRVAGNLKFDAAAPAVSPAVALLRQAVERGAASPVWVCGSTTEGEEAILLRAFRAVLEQHPAALLVLAPRHPERFPAVAKLLAASGLKWWSRSALGPTDALAGGVLLLDSLGELASVYALATLALVGGSLAPRGGHNILEPAQHGVPILVGPHTENFRDIVTLFARADALRVVAEENLAATLLSLLAEPVSRAQLGARAQAVFRAHSGATARTLDALDKLIGVAAHSSAALAGNVAP